MTLVAPVVFLIIALVLFVIAATGRVASSINLTAAGLAFLAAAMLVPMV